jgi:hypothetical protein
VPWGWQLLRFTGFPGEAWYGRRPGVRSSSAGQVESKKGKGRNRSVNEKQESDRRNLLKTRFFHAEEATIGKGIVISALSGFGTGAPFAVSPSREGTEFFSSLAPE